MLNFLREIRFNIKYYTKTLWWDVSNFFYWLKKSIEYAKFLKNDFDFDYAYILRLLQFKLKRHRKYLDRSNENIVKPENWEEQQQQMKDCEDLIERILTDEFAKDLHQAHNEKWGRLDFALLEQGGGNLHLTRKNAKTAKEKEEERKEFWQILEKEEELRNEAYHTLFYLLERHIQSWWT